MTVRIAPLGAEDLDAARALAVLADVAVGSAEAWRRDLRSTSAVLLGAWETDADTAVGAEAGGGRLVGLGTGSVAVDDADVHLVVVDPEHRRRGVGRALTLALCRTLAALGAERVLLEVRAANEPAVALYEAVGFTEVARRRSYYRDGEDAVVLALVTGAGPDPAPRNVRGA